MQRARPARRPMRRRAARPTPSSATTRSTAGRRRRARPAQSASEASSAPGGLDRLQEHVLLLAEGELDGPLRQQVAHADLCLFIDDELVVDLEAAALDLPARLAV